MELKKDVLEKVKRLREKLDADGQELGAYLDGIIISKYLSYWDYINLDTLLSLQNPKTSVPDEKVFISFHQITELYFNLIIHELEQICSNKNLTPEFFISKLRRVNRYWEISIHSFKVMLEGLDQKEFLKFRSALLPASGFQSVQFRYIELYSTEIPELVETESRSILKKHLTSQNVEKLYEMLHWRRGAINKETHEPTLTLKEFEKKYRRDIIQKAKDLFSSNLLSKYKELSPRDQENQELIEQMRLHDVNMNVNWALIHFRSAARYLHYKNTDLPSTGSTNWQEYLPPKFQKRIFFPQLWNEEEIQHWGKSWVDELVDSLKPSI